MKYYLAPMEGITGYVFRNAYHSCFGNIDRYYSPFIVPHRQRGFRERELKDIFPENNPGITLIPQLLTNNAEDVVRTAQEFRDFGYEELNLNLGCPSPTVTAKKKGSGFLEDPQELDRFFSQIFEHYSGKISVKTRIGIDELWEFEDLMKVYNRYPIAELIIHPRLKIEYYKGKAHRDIFIQAAKKSPLNICYNGDITGPEDIQELTEQLPSLEQFMIGRGILRNPGLVDILKQGKSTLNTEKMREFHDRIYQGHKELLSGDRNVLFRMKELWFYFGEAFASAEKHVKKIRKTERCADYEAAVRSLFQECELR